MALSDTKLNYIDLYEMLGIKNVIVYEKILLESYFLQLWIDLFSLDLRCKSAIMHSNWSYNNQFNTRGAAYMRFVLLQPRLQFKINIM